MNKMTLAGIMMAVTVLATGCKKDVDGDGKGPAQEAGAAIDNAGQTVATETKEATAEAAAATERSLAFADPRPFQRQSCPRRAAPRGSGSSHRHSPSTDNMSSFT